MKMKAQRWAIAVGYIGFIYATLGVVPAPLRYLRAHNMLRITLLLISLSCLAFLIFKLAQREKRWWKFSLLVGICGLYPLIAQHTSSPEEQIHFLEYGLVGVLFARALAGNGPRTFSVWSGALVLGGLAGWLDEIIQGWLPNRHYDVRDIWLNLISAALGLLIYSLYPRLDCTNQKNNLK